jgi:hypothetical protein
MTHMIVDQCIARPEHIRTWVPSSHQISHPRFVLAVSAAHRPQDQAAADLQRGASRPVPHRYLFKNVASYPPAPVKLKVR